MDDPTTDYAILPTWKLAEAASREVKVVLSGEGGDEVFAGYGRYRRRAKQTLRALRARVAPKRPSRGLLRRPDDWSAGRDDAAAAVDDPRGLTWLQRQQARDIGGWLPDDLLRKLDLCLMAHGLEGRVPFTDAAVANYGFHLPDRAKVRDNVGKHLVKTWLAEALPQARPFRRKQGFSVPVGRWLAPHADTLAELLPDQPLLHETMHPEAVRAAAQRPGRDGFLVWSLLFLAVWAQGEAAAGINGRTELFDALRDWAGRG
jgi:asparagine synthase (glutamine-hydrolysing)